MLIKWLTLEEVRAEIADLQKEYGVEGPLNDCSDAWFDWVAAQDHLENLLRSGENL